MKLILLIITLFFSSLMHAQFCEFGFKAGANFATIYNAEYEFKSGFLGGIYTIVDLKNDFAIRADVMYSQQGGKIDNADIRINYVAIPVVFHYRFLEKFHVEFGLQAALLIDEKIRLNEAVIDFGGAGDQDISIVFGVGFKPLDRVFVDLRYNQGVQDVLEFDPGASGVFSLAVRYQVL